MQYNQVEDIVDLLKDICLKSSVYEAMAERGRKAILSQHNNSIVAGKLFSLFQN